MLSTDVASAFQWTPGYCLQYSLQPVVRSTSGVVLVLRKSPPTVRPEDSLGCGGWYGTIVDVRGPRLQLTLSRVNDEEYQLIDPFHACYQTSGVSFYV